MIVNAKIKNTMLGIEDHGIMTFFIFVEWSGAGCGIGGYSLDYSENHTLKFRKGSGHAYQAIRNILEVVGVDSWEKLPGQLIRIEDGNKITKIGNILENKWFDLESYMKAEQK